ncbi:hypothetical protein DFP73DRAFT_157596 [Morchella snyderi]|nr:hypothetical protein DFP73DRAFT_157596 [Morchella snyderi]
MPKSHLLTGLAPALRRCTPQFQQQLRSIRITRETVRSAIPPESPPPESPPQSPAPTSTAGSSPPKNSVTAFPGRTFAIRRGSYLYQPGQQTPGPLPPSPCHNPAHKLPTITRSFGPKLNEFHFSREPPEKLSYALNHKMDIRDLDYHVLRHDVAFKLGVEYLSPVVHKVAHKRERLLDGVVVGVRRPRIIVPAVVIAGDGGVPRWLFFVLDSMSPWTFLSKQAMEKLNIPICTDGSRTHVTISGYDQPVYPSPPGSGFEDLNILGTGFMRQYNAYQTVDWRTRSARVFINRGGMPHFSEIRMTSWTPAGNIDLQIEKMRDEDHETESECEVREAWEKETNEGISHAEKWRRRWAGSEWDSVGLFMNEGGDDWEV